ncbi:FtsW/RodA/SpoVE family cell cycle protein [Enterococcus faecalis]|nr:FtsW/RodA/SpoVE family cell cycle protein [Enterococcus faecalis]
MNLRTLGLTKILLTFIILSIIGALMIYSASSYDLLMQGVKPTAVFIKQGIIMCLSWVLMFMIYKVRLEVLFNKKIAIGLLLVSVLLLLMVRLPFFGVARMAHNVGFLSLESSFSHQNFVILRLFIT